MTEADAWKRQADSDFAAATVLSQGNLEARCQAIAKYQQVVEKFINYMDATLREHGLLVGRVRAEHYPERMINRLVRLPQSGNREIADRLVRIFGRWLPDIHDLCDLAPKLPPTSYHLEVSFTSATRNPRSSCQVGDGLFRQRRRLFGRKMLCGFSASPAIYGRKRNK